MREIAANPAEWRGYLTLHPHDRTAYREMAADPHHDFDGGRTVLRLRGERFRAQHGAGEDMPVSRPPPALGADGVAVPGLRQQTHDSTAPAYDAQHEIGSHFENSYSSHGGGVAVMQENYHRYSRGTGYTASDAFLHQWGSEEAQTRGEVPTPAGAGPAESLTRLPERIYRQNISNARAREVIDEHAPEQGAMAFAAGTPGYEALLRTDNGKSTANAVSDFNRLGGRQATIHTVTAIRAGRNTHLRFDVAHE
jgi:hypothetical protein